MSNFRIQSHTIAYNPPSIRIRRGGSRRKMRHYFEIRGCIENLKHFLQRCLFYILFIQIWRGNTIVLFRQEHGQMYFQCTLNVAFAMKKKRSERRNHCALAVVRWGLKFSPRRRPPFPGRRSGFNGDGHYTPSLVKIDARNFELSW